MTENNKSGSHLNAAVATIMKQLPEVVEHIARNSNNSIVFRTTSESKDLVRAIHSGVSGHRARHRGT